MKMLKKQYVPLPPSPSDFRIEKISSTPYSVLPARTEIFLITPEEYPAAALIQYSRPTN